MSIRQHSYCPTCKCLMPNRCREPECRKAGRYDGWCRSHNPDRPPLRRYTQAEVQTFRQLVLEAGLSIRAAARRAGISETAGLYKMLRGKTYRTT